MHQLPLNLWTDCGYFMVAISIALKCAKKKYYSAITESHVKNAHSSLL